MKENHTPENHAKIRSLQNKHTSRSIEARETS